MEENDMTTIAVSMKTKGYLDKLKVHPNQSYDEAITILIKKVKV